MRGSVKSALAAAAVGVLLGSVSGCGSQHVSTASRHASSPSIAHVTTTASMPEEACGVDQLHLSVESAPGAYVYGTAPAHRHSAGDLEVRVPVRNLGGAARPVSAPSCTSALPAGRLAVERFGLQHQEGQPAQTSPPVPLPHTKVHVCAASTLKLGRGQYVSPMTGEHALTFPLTNVGTQPCGISGYPAITLLDQHGAPLPFRFTHGLSQYVTHAKPAPVLLSPGASAHFLIAKYRCDLGTERDAVTMQVSLGADPIELVGLATGPSGRVFSYCLGGPTDPGQVVDHSRLEATDVAVFPS